MPEYLCSLCHYQLIEAYNFHIKIRQSDAKLRNDWQSRPTLSTKYVNNTEFGHSKNVAILPTVRFHSTDQTYEMSPTMEGNTNHQGQPIGNLVKSVVQKANTNVVQEKTADTQLIDQNSANKSKTKQNRNNAKKHMCDTCGKTFLYQSNLNDHVRVHSGDKPFVCSICGLRWVSHSYSLSPASFSFSFYLVLSKPVTC